MNNEKIVLSSRYNAPLSHHVIEIELIKGGKLKPEYQLVDTKKTPYFFYRKFKSQMI